MASTPSQSVCKIEYDVFLSFRGTDTRKSLVNLLYNQLNQKGIRTFKDYEHLKKGKRIEELFQIIKESKFAIVVFSKNYASSKWCLEEIATIMECQEQYGEEIVIPIFYDVEPTEVGNQTASFGKSFAEHEERFKDDKAKVERWKEALKKASRIPGHHLQNDFKGFEAKCVQTVVDEIFARLNQSNLASTVLEKDLVGLDSRVDSIVKLLRIEHNDVQYIGIWGMGGIGKTTIAMAVFNKFSSQFDGACFLTDIRQHEIIELQKTLLGTILKEKMEISHEFDGMEYIQRCLGRKNVLIVLDDVDNVKKLQSLAGSCDWFGKGSRVIITTRDRGVLRSHGVDEKYIYEVETLGKEEAIQLFRSHAFKQKAKTGVEELCESVVRYCKGLPLALTILGCSLCGLEAAEWESTFEELKDTIRGILKISFDRLDPKNKKIFLHIACFFRHEKEEYVKDVLKSYDVHPVIGMHTLIEKSFISVQGGILEMHDLIQEMGRHIARQENPRSRVWEFKEVDDVLSRKMDPKHIECIVFPYTREFWWQNSAFKALKILIGKGLYNEEDNNFDLVVKDNYELPSSLELIHFPDYPFPSLPTTSFHPSGMDDNSLELPKELNKLTYLNLSSSYSLLETPNFDMMPNLKKLYLSSCEKLVEIHPSVGRLEKLVLLDLSYCHNLKKLPKFIQVSSLQILKLESCSELENFPEIQANMPFVQELNLESIRIRELPSSIGRLRGLTELRLCQCNYLVSLSDDLCELKSLKILALSKCPKLESLPEKLGNLSKLEELHIIETAIFQLPSSITQLSSLECLCWGGNQERDEERSLKFVPSVMELNKLTNLNLSSSYSLLETPNFGMMPNLEKLYLSNCEKLVAIHPSIECLEKLVSLDLSYCSNLKKLPKFIRVSSLQSLKLEYCSELEHFPEIQAPLVKELNLEGIGIRELPSSIGRLRGLTKLRLCDCEYLVHLSDDLCELESLKILELRECPKLESLPEKLGNMSKLEELHIIETAIFQLPSSITQLSSLECLCWGGYSESDEERSLKFVPSVSGLCSLKRLQLSDFKTIKEGLPSDLEYLVSLEYLSLRESNVVDLPESFSQLPYLQYLDIKGCGQLKKLPEATREEEQPDLPKLPKTTRELYADFRFASRRNITKLLAECPELHAVAFSDDDGNHPYKGWEEFFLSRICIRFPLPRIPRKTPFSVSYSVDENCYESPDVNALRLFQYRCYKSNGISIDLTNHSWYCDRFVGFAVYFISLEFDMWGPHSYKGIHWVEHCTVIAKLSRKNNRNEALQTKCVIVNANEGIKEHICFAYIPFSSLCPESSVTPNDFSRFEVEFMNLKATADWGCSLLYQRKRRASLEDICSCTHTLASRNDICGECVIDDMGPLGKLEYKNFSGKRFDDLPGSISKLRLIQYLDISGYKNVEELPKLPSTIRQLYAAYNRNLATEDNIPELATKYSKLSSVSFSYPMHDADTTGFLKPWELAKKFIPITQPFLNRNTPFAVTYPFDDWSDDYNIGRCFKYPHNDSNKISISLDPNWYNHNFVGFVVCFQFPEKVRWESHPDIRPFRHCKLITKLTHKDNGTEPLQIECVIGRLYDEEFRDHFEDCELVCFAYIPFSSLWPKSKAIMDTTTPNHYLVFEAAFLEFPKHFNAEDWEISTDWSCSLLYSDDESLIEELPQKRESWYSESDSENDDGGSQHTEDSGGDNAMTVDNNPDDESLIEELPQKRENWSSESDSDGGSQHTEDSGGDDAMTGGNNSDDESLIEELRQKRYEAKCAEVVAADIRARLNLSNQASPAFEENLVGLESRVNSIGNWLRLVFNDDDVARFIGICGMRGIGKTTIAMAVFNKFSSQFDGACFLADIRQHDAIELQKTLITTIQKNKSGVQISNVQDGMEEIRITLQGKKVLIVLDDVDGTEQLEKLAGGRDWFGWGSRVIITIRDASVLHSHGVVEKYIYEVQTLGEQEAIQLFRLHAFKKEPVKTGMEELCGSIVHYCKGLPLTLKVLGSSLCGLEAADWESTLEELKSTPNDDIDTKLKICFDRLDSNSKTIFLYIACFFRHEREEYVKDMLKRCDLQAFIGVRILIEKSLISVLEGRIEMHDLIQEMGWHIASLDRPRSRVWQLKDVDDVLSRKMDPKHKEGILLPSAGDINEENISELKWLDFKFYPFTSLPESFIPSKLVWFSLHHSSLEKCRIEQKLDKLIYLDLSSSYSLSETPDFDWMPNLMRLNLSDCQKLKTIHLSIGNLRKLILLDLSKCHGLERLPSFNQVSSLRSLNLLGCIRLQDFPNIRARTPHLGELDLKMVGIKELSSSIQNLHGLTKLCLGHCPHLIRLCNGLCELKTLKVLEIKNCRNLKSLPENLEGLISLEYLNLQGCCFDSLPESFSQLTCLQYLSITDCEISKKLPKLPANIKELYADCGFKIAELAIQYSKLNLVSFSTGDQHGVVTSLAKKFIHFPLHRKTPFCVSYRITSVDLEKSKMLRTFKYRHYKSNGICINLESSWYSEKFMGFVVCFSEKKGNIWGRHSYQAIDNSIHSCMVIVKLSHKDNKDEVLQTDCVVAVSSFDNSDDIYGTLCCAYIPVRSLWGESKAIKDYSRFEVQFMNVKASADWGCSLLYESTSRQTGAATHISTDGGSDSGLTTDDIGCLSPLELETEYLNLNRRDFAYLPKLPSRLQYLDISGCRRLLTLPKLPPTIKELYAHSNLAFESNIVELASKYSELYSVSFSHGYVTLGTEELARELSRKFVQVPFQNKNSHFLVTYPTCDDLMTDVDTKKWFRYSSCRSNKISINLNHSWYSGTFVGFVVCFLLKGRKQKWESRPEIHPFRYSKVIAKLRYKYSANEVLQKNCVIARLYDEEFDDKFEECKDSEFICFAYIPCSSLLGNFRGNPNNYSVFEVAFLDSNVSSNWSCGLLYKDDESLSEAIWSNVSFNDSDSALVEETPTSEEIRSDHYHHIEEDCETSTSQQQLGLDITKPWQLTEIVHQIQCLTVSMPECFYTKVARLLYTKSGGGIIAVSLNGIYKLWKWSHNRENPSAKATANSVPQYWQTNSGLLMIKDVSGVNIKEVVPCIALSNDGYFIASAFGRKISLFSTKTVGLQEMTTFMLPSASTFLAHDPCVYENIAIGTEGSVIYLYNFVKEKVIAKLDGHEKRITGLAFSTNPYMLVSSGADAQLCLYMWNILGRWKKRKSVRIQLPTSEVYSSDTQVMFHADQLHLLVTHETQLAIYDASKMERISQWIPHDSLSSPISSATYSNNSLLVYASFNDGNIGVLDAHSLRLRCCIAPSAYLSQAVSDGSRDVYPVAIVAHPQKTNQFAIGLTNGTVKVIEPREFERKWGVSPTIGNGRYFMLFNILYEHLKDKNILANINYIKFRQYFNIRFWG